MPERLVANSSPLRNAERAIGLVHRVEDGFLALLLGAMIVLAPLQIILRGTFATGITWADPMLRVLVLWLGLLGAVAASRDHRQISVDVLSHVLSGRALAAVRVLTTLFTASVAGLVAYHGARFVMSEMEFESIAFSGVPAWILASVIPFAFSAIALRNLIGTASHLHEVFRSDGEAAGASTGVSAR